MTCEFNYSPYLIACVIFLTQASIYVSSQTTSTILPTTTVTVSPICQTATTEWLEWSNWSDCTDSCGSCGIHIRTRVCLTTGSTCACTGSGTELDYCNLDICKYPRLTCCYNKVVKSFKGRFTCLAASSLVL